MGDLKLLQFPDRNIQDIPSMLRNLANTIEKGDYGDVHSLVWAAVLDEDMAVGLCGTEGFSTGDAYFIFGRAMKWCLP